MVPLLLSLTLCADPAPMPHVRAITPAEVVHVALTDARRLPPETARYVRYLSFHALERKDWADANKWLTFWLWSLSREGEPGRPRWVSPWLVAIDLREYGIDPFTYGRLADADPYFHVATTTTGKAAEQKGLYAPWLPREEIILLAKRLGTEGRTCQTAILRADWFVTQTSIQDQREGVGYYDFLALKTRGDFFKLVGFDQKLADAKKAEWRAVIERSGVSYFPRQVRRFGALDSGLWTTLDVLDDAKGPRNAIRQWDKDFAHQAEEHYGVGPSGLFVFFLSQADGTRQDAAPDKIGPDSTRQPSRRTRIEIGASCVRCHVEGLRPITNWVKEVIQTPTVAELDTEQSIRLRSLYFRDLEKKWKLDNQAYADRLKECNGLTPQLNAKLFGRLWDQYTDGPLTLADAARELGTTPERFQTALLAVRAQKRLDPAFANFLAHPPRPIRRELWEEVYPAAVLYLGGNQ